MGESKKLPVFHDFVPSRLAALLGYTDLFITGKGIPFHLCHLMKKQVLGLFKEDDLKAFCPDDENTKSITYDKIEHTSLVETILKEIPSGKKTVLDDK